MQIAGVLFGMHLYHDEDATTRRYRRTRAHRAPRRSPPAPLAPSCKCCCACRPHAHGPGRCRPRPWPGRRVHSDQSTAATTTRSRPRHARSSDRLAPAARQRHRTTRPADGHLWTPPPDRAAALHAADPQSHPGSRSTSTLIRSQRNLAIATRRSSAPLRRSTSSS
jgi:hypothetical protein